MRSSSGRVGPAPATRLKTPAIPHKVPELLPESGALKMADITRFVAAIIPRSRLGKPEM
jgi:hypothetical protein